MEISELSPEEKVKLERYEIFLKETTGIYWRTSVLFLFWMPIVDRLLSIITGMQAVHYQDVPLFFPIWATLNSFWFGMPIAFTWAGVKSLKERWATAATVVLGMLYISIGAIFFSKGLKGFLENLTYIPGNALSNILGFSLVGITVFLGIKVKWPKIVWVAAAYLGVLLVLHYGFYVPLYPDFSWAGTTRDRPSLPHEVLNITLNSYVLILAIITASLMAILSTKKIRRKVALREVLEHRD